MTNTAWYHFVSAMIGAGIILILATCLNVNVYVYQARQNQETLAGGITMLLRQQQIIHDENELIIDLLIGKSPKTAPSALSLNPEMRSISQ